MTSPTPSVAELIERLEARAHELHDEALRTNHKAHSEEFLYREAASALRALTAKPSVHAELIEIFDNAELCGGNKCKDTSDPDACPCARTARTLRALTASLSRVEGDAREALAPFAKESVEWCARTWRDDWVPFVDPSGHCSECGEKAIAFEQARFTVGDIRRAAALHARLSRAPDAGGNEGEGQ